MRTIAFLVLSTLLFPAGQTLAASASYLIPTTQAELQPLALAAVLEATLERSKSNRDEWTLTYRLPWTLSGAHTIRYQLKGELHDLRTEDKEARADCSDEVIIPNEFTQGINQDFNPGTICFVRYTRDLVERLDAQTGDFLDLVNSSFSPDEALARTLLRHDFMGEPVGFLGFDQDVTGPTEDEGYSSQSSPHQPQPK